jgi:hypothetical protein
VQLKYKLKLVEDILGLEEELWIPMHRIKEEELKHMTFEELTHYHNKLIIVKDNPV